MLANESLDRAKIFQSEIYILLSKGEAFPLGPLEAMSCGAPAIGSNCRSIPEIIGDNKAMFDPHDIDSIKKREGWNEITAIKNDRIHEIDSSIILQPGPACLTDGLKVLEQLISNR